MDSLPPSETCFLQRKKGALRGHGFARRPPPSEHRSNPPPPSLPLATQGSARGYLEPLGSRQQGKVNEAGPVPGARLGAARAGEGR